MRFRSFFYAQKSGKRLEEETCVQRLHWHAQNVSNVTTIPLKIRRHILTGWRLRNIVDSARLTQCTKKPNNFTDV